MKFILQVAKKTVSGVTWLLLRMAWLLLRCFSLDSIKTCNRSGLYLFLLRKVSFALKGLNQPWGVLLLLLCIFPSCHAAQEQSQAGSHDLLRLMVSVGVFISIPVFLCGVLASSSTTTTIPGQVDCDTKNPTQDTSPTSESSAQSKQSNVSSEDVEDEYWEEHLARQWSTHRELVLEESTIASMVSIFVLDVVPFSEIFYYIQLLALVTQVLKELKDI